MESCMRVCMRGCMIRFFPPHTGPVRGSPGRLLGAPNAAAPRRRRSRLQHTRSRLEGARQPSSRRSALRPESVHRPVELTARPARAPKALADNCVELIGDMKSGGLLEDFGDIWRFLFGESTDGMSDEEKEAARLAISDILFIPEVTPLWPRLEPSL